MFDTYRQTMTEKDVLFTKVYLELITEILKSMLADAEEIEVFEEVLKRLRS